MRKTSLILVLAGLSAIGLGQSFSEGKIAVPKKGPPVISLFNTASAVSVNPATDYLFLHVPLGGDCTDAEGCDRKALVSTVLGGGGGTHNLLSSTHPDTTAEAPTRGSWITADATPKWVRRDKCASGQFLGGDGTDMLCMAIAPTTSFGAIAAQATSPGTLQGTGGNTNFYISGRGILQQDALTTTTTPGLTLQNATASTVGTPQQYSPCLELVGHGWDTDGAVDVETTLALCAQPDTSTNPRPIFRLRGSDSGAAYVTWLQLDTGNGTPVLAVTDLDGYFQPSSTANGSFACKSSTGCGTYGATGQTGSLSSFEASSFRSNLSTKTANYTTTALDSVLIADTSSVSITFTLIGCTSSLNGLRQSFIKTAAANTMTLDGNASETINGATTQAKTGQYSTIEVVCASTQWFIVSQSGS